jgi:hypothetical protein
VIATNRIRVSPSTRAGRTRNGRSRPSRSSGKPRRSRPTARRCAKAAAGKGEALAGLADGGDQVQPEEVPRDVAGILASEHGIPAPAAASNICERLAAIVPMLHELRGGVRPPVTLSSRGPAHRVHPRDCTKWPFNP